MTCYKKALKDTKENQQKRIKIVSKNSNGKVKNPSRMNALLKKTQGNKMSLPGTIEQLFS